MGSSYFSEEILIVPPLTWAEVRGGPDLRDVALRIVEETTDTDEGQLKKLSAAGVGAANRYFKGYDVQPELQALVDAHPGHDFTGYIEVRCEDPECYPSRLTVRGREVIRIEPRIVWPEDEAG